jgi:ABC-type sugar transport system permease subunit
MLGVIGSLQTFALIYTMTSGGPNSASEMPGTYIFRTGFTTQRMGYASAISTVILIFTLVVTAFQMIALKSGNLSITGGTEK